jgi:hypothetical protein
MDRTENITPSLLFNFCLVGHAENTIPLLFAAYCIAAVIVLLFVSQSLPSNEPLCHIAPSLRQFFPYSLQVYRHFLFSEAFACDVSSFVSEGADPSTGSSHSLSAT